jgi:hypothetical protein
MINERQPADRSRNRPRNRPPGRVEAYGDFAVARDDRALQAITGTRLGCVLPLSAAPPAPDNVSVVLDGQVIARDPSHAGGWDYTDSRSVAVQLYGLSCTAFLAHAFDLLEIDFGCSALAPDGGADAHDAGTM